MKIFMGKVIVGTVIQVSLAQKNVYRNLYNV